MSTMASMHAPPCSCSTTRTWVLTPPSSRHTNLGTMRIGEVSDLSGVSVRMLRHYDRAGLLSPSHRTSTDYRDYSPADLGRLFRIEALRSLGLTLAEVGDALDDPTRTPHRARPAPAGDPRPDPH